MPVIVLSAPVPPVAVDTVSLMLETMFLVARLDVAPAELRSVSNCVAADAVSGLFNAVVAVDVVTLFTNVVATLGLVMLLAAFAVCANPAAALIIAVSLPEFSALTKFTAALAVLTSELPVNWPAADNAPAQLPLLRLIPTFNALPASAKEIVSVSIVVLAKFPMVGLFTKDVTNPVMSPLSNALATRSPVAASVKPPAPAKLAKPPIMSPLLIAIAALIACANGATPGMNDAIARIGAMLPISLLDAPVV